MNTEQVVLEVGQLRQFTARVFLASGSPREEAEIVADHLVTSNLMGYDSHGVIRIPQYLEEIEKKIIRPGAPFKSQRNLTPRPLSSVAGTLARLVASKQWKLPFARRRRHTQPLLWRVPAIMPGA